MMNNLLTRTALLDYDHSSVNALFLEKNWMSLEPIERARAIYEFLRDEIKFGYNAKEPIKASEVLQEGYGQCNTKSILAMALFRKAGFPSRFHVFGIDKSLQKGAQLELVYQQLPQLLQHSWVEVQIDGCWLELEGMILDKAYLSSIQQKFSSHQGGFCGFAIAVDDIHRLNVDWNSNGTQIQKAAIVQDWGVFDSPDDFYAHHPSNLHGWKGLLWRIVLMRPTNKRLEAIRTGHFPVKAESFLCDLPRAQWPQLASETKA